MCYHQTHNLVQKNLWNTENTSTATRTVYNHNCVTNVSRTFATNNTEREDDCCLARDENYKVNYLEDEVRMNIN